MHKKSGSSTIETLNSYSGPTQRAYTAAGGYVNIVANCIYTVTGTGTLVMRIMAESNGSSITSGEVHLQATFLKKQ